MTDTTLPIPSRSERNMYSFSKHWATYVIGGLFVFVGLPFLAPLLMHLGLTGPGRVIYFVYSFLCHQLPERSFFLFGPKFMYPLSQIQAAWQNTINPLVLRQFIGNPQMGWKVAWSDRMVSMYTSIPVFGMLWATLRKKIKPLPFWGFVLFLLPMALDGGTHFLSDFAGIGQGFRYTNLWLATLTHHAFPASFYLGDAIGSFNSYMRILTGILFGIGIVWYGFPYLEESFNETIDYFDRRYTH